MGYHNKCNGENKLMYKKIIIIVGIGYLSIMVIFTVYRDNLNTILLPTVETELIQYEKVNDVYYDYVIPNTALNYENNTWYVLGIYELENQWEKAYYIKKLEVEIISQDTYRAAVNRIPENITIVISEYDVDKKDNQRVSLQ